MLFRSAVDDYEYIYNGEAAETGSDNLLNPNGEYVPIKGQELGFHIGAKYLISSRFSGGVRYFSGSDLNKSQLFTKVNLKGFAFFVEMKI